MSHSSRPRVGSALRILFCLALASVSITEARALTDAELNAFEVEGINMGLSLEQARKTTEGQGYQFVRESKRGQLTKIFAYSKKEGNKPSRVNLEFDEHGFEGYLSAIDVQLPNPGGEGFVTRESERVIKAFDQAEALCKRKKSLLYCDLTGTSETSKLRVRIKLTKQQLSYKLFRQLDRKLYDSKVIKDAKRASLEIENSEQQDQQRQAAGSASKASKEQRKTEQNDAKKQDGDSKAESKKAPESAKKSLREKAEAGDAVAQFELALKHDRGEGVEQDFEEAVRWYEKSAEQGNADAQYNLAVKYAKGEGAEQDQQKAAELYRQAAQQGDADAEFNLGLRYANGIGVEQSDEKAFAWFQKSADHGHVTAQYNLATMHEFGIGTAADDVEAKKWYRLAAQQGHQASTERMKSMSGEAAQGQKSQKGSSQMVLPN